MSNVEVHTPAAGGAASTQVEGGSDGEKSNSRRAAGCGATPCSPFDSVLAALGNTVPASTTKALAKAAKDAGGVLIVRYKADAELHARLDGVETLCMAEVAKAKGRLLFWEPGAIHHLCQKAMSLLDE